MLQFRHRILRPERERGGGWSGAGGARVRLPLLYQSSKGFAVQGPVWSELFLLTYAFDIPDKMSIYVIFFCMTQLAWEDQQCFRCVGVFLASNVSKVRILFS